MNYNNLQENIEADYERRGSLMRKRNSSDQLKKWWNLGLISEIRIK